MRRSLGVLALSAAVLGGSVLTAPPAAAAAETPSFTAMAAEVPDERVDIAIEGSGYGDVQALPGQSEPHAYFTLIEKGSDLAEVTQTQPAVSAAIAEDGTLNDVLTVPATELDPSSEYEVISWPTRSSPTEESLYARADVTIDWTALFPESSSGGSEDAPDDSGEDPVDPADPSDPTDPAEPSDPDEEPGDQDENTAPEPTSPTFTTEVTEVPEERIDIAIEGSGYGDVQALPGQDGPHAYFTLIEKDSDLAAVEDTQSAISASIDPDGRLSGTLPIPADELDATAEYEVISWPTRSFPTEENLYARADVTVDWDALFPSGAPDRVTVTLSADRTSAYVGQEVTLTARVPPEIDGTITFWNGTDQLGRATKTTSGTATLKTKTLPVGDHRITARFMPDAEGYAESTSAQVSIAVSERSTEGSLQWGVKGNFRSYVTGDIANGRITVSKGARQAAGNGVFTFPQASSGTHWNGRTGTVQYAGQVNFYGHGGALDHTIANPSIRVTGASNAELRVNYGGKTIAFAAIDLSTATKQELDGDAVRFSGASAKLTRAGAEFFSYQGHEFYSPGEALDRITFTVGEGSDVGTSKPPATRPGDGGKRPPQSAAPEADPTDRGAAAGALEWGISSAFVAYTTCEGKERFGYSHCAKGSISTSGVGGGYLFPQAADSDWDPGTQTGTVRYSGVVSFHGYGMTMFTVSNPSITVEGPDSATLRTGNTAQFGAGSYPLDLSSASMTEGPNGEVTWSGVGVEGSLTGGPGGGSANSVGFDDLSFTVGTASGETFGDTQDGDEEPGYEPAATPPATTGLEVLTPAERIREGGRIQVEAEGFDADDSGVLVVLYESGSGSGPILLDEDASADADGVVRWSGTLPERGTGGHVITVQGSADAGAEIEILEKREAVAAGAVAAPPGAVGVSGWDGAPETSSSGVMALWEWWMIAVSLVAIAGCTSVLAIRQRWAPAVVPA